VNLENRGACAGVREELGQGNHCDSCPSVERWWEGGWAKSDLRVISEDISVF